MIPEQAYLEQFYARVGRMLPTGDKGGVMSNRLKFWKEFSDWVAEHVETYTVPQYGDYPDDELTDFTPEEIVMNMKRYLNRSGRGQRGLEDELADCFKLANYAGELWAKKKGLR